MAERRPQRSKRQRVVEERSLFTPAARCPATREAVLDLIERGEPGCPLCEAGPDLHDTEDADVIRDDRGDFGAWLLSLPRSQSGGRTA